MNNLILALLLAGLYYIAEGYSRQGGTPTTSGYSGVDSDTLLRNSPREGGTLLQWKSLQADDSATPGARGISGAIPACSLSFEDRQQLEEFLEDY